MSVYDIDWSCPADLEPYSKAKELERRVVDEQSYVQGLYNLKAFEVVMAHFGAGLSGKKSSAEYLSKPIMEKLNNNRILTEEEKQREVDLFFARENARRINWKNNHNK